MLETSETMGNKNVHRIDSQSRELIVPITSTLIITLVLSLVLDRTSDENVGQTIQSVDD